MASQPLAEKRLEIPEVGEVPDVDIVVPDTQRTSLRVRVGDARGGALGGAAVAWIPADRAGPEIARGKTSADGEVVLEGAGRPGSFVVVEIRRYAPARLEVDEAALANGRIDVRMPGGVARGRVVRLDGSAAPPLKLRISALMAVPGRAWPDWVGGNEWVDTDNEGRFEFLGLGDGEYSVDVPNPSWMCVGAGATCRAGDEDVRLVVGTDELDLFTLKTSLFHGEECFVENSVGFLVGLDAVIDFLRNPLGPTSDLLELVRL